MLNSLEIYQALNELGYRLGAGRYEPSYASEHELGNGKYLYVKRRGEEAVNASPLVLSPEALQLRAEIDNIVGIHCDWQKARSTSYRRYPKDNGTSQYGYDADVESIEALTQLLTLLSDRPFISARAENNHEKSNKEPVAMIYPLNQILFGPPGTGKTYTTTEMAVRMADNAWYQQIISQYQGAELRDQVKKRYQSLVEKQRIMFTTFHQSFSYEDFIEGIRAVTDDASGSLRYEVVDGIFKQLCLNAKVKVQGSGASAISLTGRRIWKMSLGNTLEGEDYIYQECLASNYVLLGWGADIDYSDCLTYDEVKARSISEQSPEATSNYMSVAVNTFKNIIKNGDIVIISDGNHKFRAIAEITGDYRYLPNDERDDFYQMRAVKWLRTYTPSLPKEQIFLKSLSQMTLYELQDSSVDRQKLTELLAPSEEEDRGALPHVLIIDEINRGNIARIFGELITLLEPDKRQGAEDERSLVLPYSKQAFSVPHNVHVIGTMNTADKSLIQMDLALRRRFSFIEMPAQPDLLAGVTVFNVDIAQLLTRINQRIEVLLDSEHTIGHAYFMPLKSLTDDGEREIRLAEIFREKIIPLLREYFFDDYERIGWVLNDLVKTKENRFILLQDDAQLTKLAELFPKEISASLSDRRFRINQQAFTSAEAYQGIVA